MKYTEYHYVPLSILRAWADGNGMLNTFSKSGSEKSVKKIDDVYVENIITKRNVLPPDLFNSAEYKAFFEKMQKGEGNLSKDDDYLLKELIALEYYLNPLSSCRAFDFLGYGRKGIRKALESSFKERTDEELVYQNLRAMFYLAYILDLDSVLLSSPSSSSFVLPPSPLFISDPAFGSDALFSEKPFTANGAILFMPLSPSFALAVYDSYVYKVKKTDGKVELREEDVREYNRISLSFFDNVVYDGSKTDIDALASETDDNLTQFSFSPSAFSLRARYIEVQELQERVFCGLIAMKDARYIGENGRLTITREEQIKRYTEVSDLLHDLKNA